MHLLLKSRAARRRPRLFTGLFAGLAIAVLALDTLPAQGAPAAPAKAVTVHIVNFEFAPAVVTVAPGTTISWINDDEDAHSVVSDTGAFHSKAMDTNDTYNFTFAGAGTYAYHCGLHPHMVAKIIVKP